MGDVYWVRVIGALAMIDDGATDWKIIAIRLSDPRAKTLYDLADVVETVALDGVASSLPPPPPAARRPALRADAAGGARVAAALDDFAAFLRDYKKADPGNAAEASPVTFAFGGAYLNAASAVAVVQRHHLHWCRALAEAAAGKRVGSLTEPFRGYQRACDDARAAWPPALDDADAPLLPAEDGGGDDAALWFPVDAVAERADIAEAVLAAADAGKPPA